MEIAIDPNLQPHNQIEQKSLQPVIQPISLPLPPVSDDRHSVVIENRSSRRGSVGKQNPSGQFPPRTGIQVTRLAHMAAEEQQGIDQATAEAPATTRRMPKSSTVNGRTTVEFREPPADFDWEKVEEDKKNLSS